MHHSFGVIGGDKRQAELTRLLKEDGHTVYSYGLEKWKAVGATSLERAAIADVIVLPLPLCKGEGVLNCEEAPVTTIDLFRRFMPEQYVLAGQVNANQRKEAESCRLRVVDYFMEEELTVANAAATAEGAIQIAMEKLDRTLLGMHCLVLGFGRIGKLLSYRLHGLGARVTATARKAADLAWIQAYGWQAVKTGCLGGELGSFGAVFNTIPSMVLDATLLKQLPQNCLCVDLASKQGIDLAAAEDLGLPNVWARSLPGLLVPQTAAAVIRDTVYYIINNNE